MCGVYRLRSIPWGLFGSEVRRTNRLEHGLRRRRIALRRRISLSNTARAARCAGASDLLDTAYLREHHSGPFSSRCLTKVGVRSRRERVGQFLLR